MKLFKKKHKDKLDEQPEAMGAVGGMPAPPSVPSQDPRHSSRRNLQAAPQQDPRYSRQQQQQQQDPRYSQQQQDPRYSQQQQDPRYIQQQQDPRYSQQHQQDPRGHRQQQQPERPQQDPRGASYRQMTNQRPPDARYMQQQAKQDEYDAPPVRRQQQVNQEYDAPPVRQQRQVNQEYDVPPARQQQAMPEYDEPQEYDEPPARQSFEPTQEPPAKESSAPVVFIDPVVQMERAAITRELVKQYVADIWNRGDLDLIPKVCARGLRFNGSAGMDRVGHEGFARMVQTIRGSLEDYHCEIHSMVVEGNKAFCRMRFTGRHVGQLLGHEATGKHVSWMGASEFTMVDGLIVKVWELGDMASLEHQLRQASSGGGGGGKGRPGPAGEEEGM